ncbi:MAG: PQQ-binding-like beta-propeller repeat protein [Myxococcota bacterium]
MRRSLLLGSLALASCFNPDPADVDTEPGGGESASSGGTSDLPSTTQTATTTSTSAGTSTTDSTTDTTEATATSTTESADTTRGDDSSSSTTSTCVSDCDGRVCGGDGCGGQCGSCSFNESCEDDGTTCETIVDGCEDTGGYQPGSPWPTLGYCETRIFRSPLDGPTDEPSVLWTYDVAQPLNDIVIAADGTIYGGTNDGSLHAIDGSDGSEIWVTALGPQPANEAPAIAADGSIFVQTRSATTQTGVLYKVSPEGDVLWDVSAGSGLEVSSSPLIASDGTVYVLSGSTVLGYDGGDGAAVFESDFLNSEFGTGGLARGPGGRFYVAGEDRLYGIEPNGSDFWEYLVGNDAFLQSYPAVTEDGVYFTGRGFANYFVLLEADDGSLVAERSPVSVDDSFAVSATGRVFFGTTAESVVSANPSGTMLFDNWSVGAPTPISGELLDFWTGRITLDRLGNSYRGWLDGTVLAIGPNGTPLWDLSLDGDFTAAVVVAENETLLVPGGDGLYALRVQ